MTAISGVAGSLAFPRRSVAQKAGVIALNERLALVTTGGTNVLALTASDGLLLVDTGTPELNLRLMDSLRELPPNGRVVTVFNTHWHPENTGGNDIFGQASAKIIAHENTRVWMSTPSWMPAQDRYRPARLPKAIPTETFYTSGSMTAGREHIEYGYLMEAHTSSDIYVFFRDSNVLAVGDVASPVRDPELDYFTGAWIGGRADALERLVALSDDKTRIVPGFGPVMTRADLQIESHMMKTIYDRTVDRVRQGDYVDDMLKGGVLNGFARQWKDPKKFLYDLQKGLWAHHNKLNPNVV